MIYFQIISPVGKDECIPIIGSIMDMLDEGLYRNLKQDFLPSFKKELKGSPKTKTSFKVELPSLSKKFTHYTQYLTDFLITYGPSSKSHHWKDYQGKFLEIMIDDNSFALQKNLSQNELKVLVDEMKKTSLAIGKILEESEKSYICIYSGEVIHSYKIQKPL